MTEVQDYQLLANRNPFDLNTEIGRWLMRGYRPACPPISHDPWVIQAMIKYEQSTDSNTAGGGNPEPAGDTRPS